jgi:hypothetical protein
MKMTQAKLLIGLFLTFSIFSCVDEQEGEVVYSETFNIDELEDSLESEEDFVQKYSDYLKNTIEIYNLNDSDVIVSNSVLNSESDDLNQTVEFEFDYSSDNSKYYILNNLAKFHNLEDIETGWNLGESSFWSGLFSKNVTKESFTEFRNEKINSIGDYSEYSELPIGNNVMIILHIKWRKLIIHYNQLIEPGQKDQLIQKIHDNFGKIKESYNTLDQEKIDQVVDKAINDIKNEGL